MPSSYKRLRELDFLRGIAIILVLLRHGVINVYTTQMGWIGVDLFFVLSGYLVSGLLFKEYKMSGKIDARRFLIRRGFKIYPIYYLSYPLYLLPLIINGKFEFWRFISDMLFIQNYTLGWGFGYEASWSLAVEEHFYFGLAIFLWYAVKNKSIELEISNDSKTGAITKIVLSAIFLCLTFRILSNLFLPFLNQRNITMTHLRIDSLLTGVLISYLMNFKTGFLENIFKKHKSKLLFLASLLLFYTPFIEPNNSFFVKTFGFTFLLVAFGIILTYFLTEKRINEKLDSVFSRLIVDSISKIGFCSYSIYIIHTFFIRESHNYHSWNKYAAFFIASALSIICGMAMTYIIEKYFLNIRDKYFPSHSSYKKESKNLQSIPQNL